MELMILLMTLLIMGTKRVVLFFMMPAIVTQPHFPNIFVILPHIMELLNALQHLLERHCVRAQLDSWQMDVGCFCKTLTV